MEVLGRTYLPIFQGELDIGSRTVSQELRRCASYWSLGETSQTQFDKIYRWFRSHDMNEPKMLQSQKECVHLMCEIGTLIKSVFWEKGLLNRVVENNPFLLNKIAIEIMGMSLFTVEQLIIFVIHFLQIPHLQ